MKTTADLRVSVAMPTYNGARYLRAMLESVREQSMLPWELVVSDDRSTDDTLLILANFAQSKSLAVKVVDHVPGGVTANYLNALAHSSGDIVVFADQDDWWYPQRIEEIAQAFAADPTRVLVSVNSEIVDESLRATGRTLYSSARASRRCSTLLDGVKAADLVIRGLPLLAHTLAVRAACKHALLAKPDSIADWWFEDWVSIRCLALGNFHLIPTPLTRYRQHRRQLVGAPAGLSIQDRAVSIRYTRKSEQLEFLCHQMSTKDRERTQLGHEEFDHRRVTIRLSAKFFRRRAAMQQQPYLERLRVLMDMSLLSSYFRFASGLLSLGRDLFRKI